MFFDFLEDVVPLPGRIESDVFRPEQDGALFFGEGAVVTLADGRYLAFRDAYRLTNRRVVSQSVGAVVELTGLDDGELLRLRLEGRTKALAQER